MTPQQTFINTEIWILTFGGAFQRANIYADKVSEKQRKAFRDALILKVEKDLLPQYKNEVSEEKHIQNILEIVAYSHEHTPILKPGQLYFGVAQKLLNLYLKYQWCLGNIAQPPHFPVDRIIQQKLKFKPIINWTSMKSEEEYKSIINHAQDKIKETGLSLAEWELEEFARK